MRITEKQETTLLFLKSEVWASLKSISVLFNGDVSNTKRHLSHLESKGLIKSNSLYVAVYGSYRNVFYLSSMGAGLIMDVAEFKNFKLFSVSNVSQSAFFHSQDCQIFHAMSILNNWISWKRGDLLKRRSGLHYPGAVCVDPSNRKLCVEVERNIKSYNKYISIFGQYISMLDSGKLDYVAYLCPDELIANKVKDIFFDIKSFSYNNKSFYCPLNIRNKFLFLTYDNFFVEIDDYE